MEHKYKRSPTIPNLDKFPLLQYLKEPVSEVGDLYNRYPDGGARGWFAFVESSGTFFFWSNTSKDWKAISGGGAGTGVYTETDPTVADWAKKGADTATLLSAIGGQPLLRSGVNIATINGKSLLGGGNIVIEGGSTGGGTGEGVYDFMNLNDVDTATITSGKFLQWNGSKVVGATVNSGGGGIVSETDPVFSSHIVSAITAGSGHLKRSTSGWEWDNSMQTHINNSNIHVTATNKTNWNTAYNHIANTSNPHGVTKSQIGLGNVTNESKETMFANPKFTGTAEATAFKTGNWTITGGTTLVIAYNGAKKASISSSGEIVAIGEITAYGS